MPTTERFHTINNTTLLTAVQHLLVAREAAKQADEAKKAAEALFLTVAEAMGQDEVETPEGIRVRVENRPTRTFDVSVLAELLPVDTVAQVLKEAIDPALFDAAVLAGLISEQVADKAITTKYSTQVRVYGEQGVRAKRAS
jgi:hypothetical protein